jgi:hypothetical protein
MEWVIANWQYCLLVLYVVEKIVKITPVKWDDLLIDGIKEAFGMWKKGSGRLKTILVPLLCLPILSCATGPQEIPVGCENSVIVNQIPNYKEVDFVLKLANVQAIKGDLYTKSQALEVLDEFEAMLNSGVTYANFASLVMQRIGWVNESAGVEIFMLSEYVGLFAKPFEIDPCDRDLLLKHIAKQKMYINMIITG